MKNEFSVGVKRNLCEMNWGWLQPAHVTSQFPSTRMVADASDELVLNHPSHNASISNLKEAHFVNDRDWVCWWTHVQIKWWEMVRAHHMQNYNIWGEHTSNTGIRWSLIWYAQKQSQFCTDFWACLYVIILSSRKMIWVYFEVITARSLAAYSP